MFEELPHVVAHWLPVDEVTLLAGHGGGGKSYCALVLAVHVALGLRYGPLVTRQAPVLFASCEDGKAVLQQRLGRICKAMRLERGALDGKLYLLDASDRDSALYREQRGQGAVPTAMLPELAALAESLNAGLVIVDNASDTFDANEIDRAAVRGFIRALRSSIARPGRAVLLLAHVNKASAKGGREAGAEDYSGSSAWHNSVRSRLSLFPSKDGGMSIEHMKANLGRKAEPLTIEWRDGVPLPAIDEMADDEARKMAQQQQAQRDEADKAALVAIIQDFDQRGERVPVATTGPHSAYRTLSLCAGWPAGLTAQRFLALIRRLESEGRLYRVARRTADRKTREVFTCQPEG